MLRPDAHTDVTFEYTVTPNTDGFPDEDLLLDVIADEVLPKIDEFEESYYGGEEGLEIHSDGTATLTIHYKYVEPDSVPLDTLELLFRDELKRNSIIGDVKLENPRHQSE